MQELSRQFTQRHVKTLAQATCYAVLLSVSSSVLSEPLNGNIIGGSGTIDQSGLNTTINQTSQNMAIDWQSYHLRADVAGLFANKEYAYSAQSNAIGHRA